ncbi:MAG: S-layer homology domain-containing protein [Tissierellales bacterium]
MRKRIISLTLVLILILSCGVQVFAEKPVPTSLEKPESLTVRDDNDILRVTWVNPISIVQASEDVNDSDYDEYAQLFYLVDWKKNDGQWNICPSPEDPNFNDDTNGYFYENMPNVQIDNNGSSELFFVTWHLDPNSGPSDTFDLANNTYSFRMRYVLEPEESNTVFSPYSDVFAIGKNASSNAPTKLDPPTNLKVEVIKNTNGKPYFQLNWANPASANEADKFFPVYHVIDFKIGNGPWLSDKHWDEMAVAPSQMLLNSATIDPVEEGFADKVVIAENTYSFRVALEGAPTTSGPKLHSTFSNIVSTKMEAYSDASNWAKPELDKANDYGLIPNSLKGADMTKPITREEFAELAVKLYEKTTGFTPNITVANPFKDTDNPEILKAYELKITDGTSATTFEPNKLINREQVATMLSRSIRIMVKDLDTSTSGAPTFKDEKDISSWALDHVRFMSKNGIIQGSDGKFMPKAITSAQIAEGYANTTREQAIAMGLRSYEKFK